MMYFGAMIELGVVFILLTNGGMVASDQETWATEESSEDESNSFAFGVFNWIAWLSGFGNTAEMSGSGMKIGKMYVEVETDDNNRHRHAKPKIFSENGIFHFEKGETIISTCTLKKQRRNTTLQWSDNYEFGTKKIEQLSKLKLNLTLDKYDDGLKLTCKADGHRIRKLITISLVAKKYSTFVEPVLQSTLKHLKLGEAYKATCNGLMYRMNQNRPVSAKLDDVLIEHFKETDNGTVIFCVAFENTNPGKEDMFVRRKTKLTLHLVITENTTTATTSTTIQQTTKTDEGNGLGSQSSPANPAIVGGTVVIVLSFVLLAIWYKRKQKKLSGDAANEVIYAEIEERPPAVPPPRRRDEPPYAVIAGTLVPKPSGEENLYSKAVLEKCHSKFPNENT